MRRWGSKRGPTKNHKQKQCTTLLIKHIKQQIITNKIMYFLPNKRVKQQIIMITSQITKTSRKSKKQKK